MKRSLIDQLVVVAQRFGVRPCRRPASGRSRAACVPSRSARPRTLGSSATACFHRVNAASVSVSSLRAFIARVCASSAVNEFVRRSATGRSAVCSVGVGSARSASSALVVLSIDSSRPASRLEIRVTESSCSRRRGFVQRRRHCNAARRLAGRDRAGQEVLHLAVGRDVAHQRHRHVQTVGITRLSQVEQAVGTEAGVRGPDLDERMLAQVRRQCQREPVLQPVQ
jgi:hypothetical protein